MLDLYCGSETTTPLDSKHGFRRTVWAKDSGRTFHAEVIRHIGTNTGSLRSFGQSGEWGKKVRSDTRFCRKFRNVLVVIVVASAVRIEQKRVPRKKKSEHARVVQRASSPFWGTSRHIRQIAALPPAEDFPRLCQGGPY